MSVLRVRFNNKYMCMKTPKIRSPRRTIRPKIDPMAYVRPIQKA